MQHIIFEPNSNNEYENAILIKESAFNKTQLLTNYVSPLVKLGAQKDSFIAFDLEYNAENKAPTALIKQCLNNVLKALSSLGVKNILVADAAYFKILTNLKKAEPYLGYILPCKITDFKHMNVVLTMNHASLFYNPSNQQKIDLSLKNFGDYLDGIHKDIGSDIIKFAYYPDTLEDIKGVLERLHIHEELSIDIETFSLDFYKAGIGTIAFSWNKHEGVAFCVDYQGIGENEKGLTGIFAKRIDNLPVKKLLLDFFKKYKGKTKIYHNAGFDIKILCYELFMESLLDTPGMVHGIKTLTANIEDTKIITYLATNTTAGNKLSLKDQAHEYAGNYAQSDISNIKLIPKKELLKYNLIDSFCNWFTHEKRYPEMVEANQLEIYKDIFIPSIPVIMQMELTGMPMNMDEIRKADSELEKIKRNNLRTIKKSPIIKKYEETYRKEEWVKKNLLLKVKVVPLSDFTHLTFNPNSTKQIKAILYDQLELPVLGKTDTGNPATGIKTLIKLTHRTKDPEILVLLDALINYIKVNKILTSFISAFKLKTVFKQDGRHYLHGNFNLGGTVSGRLSSSNVNLQQLPSSGTPYAKPVKKCFSAPSGWLMGGADFTSLEDKISALTTKDPNKLKVYIEGYDGHCLRAYSYYPDKFLHIPNTVEGINSIKDLHPDLRQDSKEPTFALTYQGTWYTLVNDLGLPEERAKEIEDNYRNLYKVSDKWVKDKLQQASKDGYITGAFGLRLRTPILKQTVLNQSNTPYEAQAESRTAGNALGQSYGLLNNRAAIEFMGRVWSSDYRFMIKPIAMVHDSMYFLIKNRADCVAWVNRNLIECMEWQDLPELGHDKIKLGGEFELYHPSWAETTKIPKNATPKEILSICKKEK